MGRRNWFDWGIINYLDGSYEDYGYYRSNITSRYLVYNVNDINKLELYISNTDGKDVKIITSNETYNVENDGYYSFVSKNGKVTIEVTDKMSSDTKDKSYYYQN